MAIVLAIDTSLCGCSVCVFDTELNKVIAQEASANDTKQAEELAPMVDRVWGGQKIDFVTATTGPGSFTGIRIGLSFAKTFAFGVGVPFVPVQSFSVARATHGDSYDFFIDTKRGDFYKYSVEEGISIAPEIPSNSQSLLISSLDICDVARAAVKYPAQNDDPVYVRDAEVSVSKTIPPRIIA